MMLLRKCLKIMNDLGDLGLYRRLSPPLVPVFMLHRVTVSSSVPKGISPDYLLRCLNHVNRHGYQAMALSELLRMLENGLPLPPKACVFTIDDGFVDHYHAAELFDQHQIPLNYFVISDFLDRELWPWDDQVAHALAEASAAPDSITGPDGTSLAIGPNDAGRTGRVREQIKQRDQSKLYPWLREQLFPQLGLNYPDTIPAGYEPMSWDQARDLVKRGHEVYPHTRSHRILSRLPPASQTEEIQHAAERVQSETGLPWPAFAYPTGRLDDYDAESLKSLQECSLRYAFNTRPDYVQSESPLLELPRYSMPENFEDFRKILTLLAAIPWRPGRHKE